MTSWEHCAFVSSLVVCTALYLNWWRLLAVQVRFPRFRFLCFSSRFFRSFLVFWSVCLFLEYLHSSTVLFYFISFQFHPFKPVLILLVYVLRLNWQLVCHFFQCKSFMMSYLMIPHVNIKKTCIKIKLFFSMLQVGSDAIKREIRNILSTPI